MLQVAREANVSKNTVSLALRNDPQIPEQTRDRIKSVAKRLGYTKNPTVAHLMTQLRSGAETGFKATLALVNANEDREAFTVHPTIPTYVEGCRRAAQRQGYNLDEFWLHDAQVKGDRLLRILRSRRIRGVLIVGMMNENRLPDSFRPVWENLPCVVTGVRTRDPALSFACTDHHILTMRAVEQAIALGYERPGLVLDQVIDHLVEGRFSAGYFIAQQALPQRRRISPFYYATKSNENPKQFRSWLEKEKPDVILSLYHIVARWIASLSLRVPEDIGLIQLEWRQDHPNWAGMHQHNDIVGEAAVGMVIEMIHNNERGAPPFPKATLIGSTWIPGKTVKLRSTAGRRERVS
ncbi:LacI family transcriptional regulator [Spartobacteria bacterium LR76]|nr:LacI family transcriptional regulator [Spartobacteria bacterium LR76]